MTAVHCTEGCVVLIGITMQVRVYAMQCRECTRARVELQWSMFLTMEEVCLSKS